MSEKSDYLISMTRKAKCHQNIVLLALAAAMIGGCAVPQPRGRGTRFFLKEPKSGRGYFLYLPAGYTPSKAWPLVLTLHGMKPFDHAESQELEWESIADKDKMVVLAPDLHNSDLFMEYPLRNITRSVEQDERIVVTMINDVIRRCSIDRSKIFATSWSSGGYLLHYIVNNNPDMFAGVCARGSCFSLDANRKIPKWKIRRLAERKIPVLIYYGSNDFAGIRKESEQAVTWYKQLKMPVIRKLVEGKGHERVPELAAGFFVSHGAAARPVQPVEILVSSERGLVPFWVNLRAKLAGVNPRDYSKYKFAWYINDKLEGAEPTLFMTIYRAGEHPVKLEVTSPYNQKFEAHDTLVVLPRQRTVRAEQQTGG